MSATSASSAMRVARAENVSLGPERMADVLARAFELWRDRGYARRRAAIAEIARSTGFSVAMLDESIDALLKPFTRDALSTLAARVLANGNNDRPKTVGFIAAGNVVGAGIHEIAIALIAGARIAIKTASAEPIFFAEFARTIAEIDCDADARIEVLHWGRERADLTAALIANSELVVAYGNDATIGALRRPDVIGFGSRVSAAVAAVESIDCLEVERVAKLLARDVALFEQLGCLSPHQIFVLGSEESAARTFAIAMAHALEDIGKSMPPAQLQIRDASEIRGVREHARWRAIAGDAVELFEGNGLEWTLVFERRAEAGASFKISPAFRTVHATAVRNLAELRACLAGVAARIEAMAVAGDGSGGIRSAIAKMGIPYVCAPGEMQSPPLEWAHGGGSFLDAILRTR